MMTAPVTPLAEARREAEEALATWDVCCKQHEDTCQCGTWPMKDAIRSLLAALQAKGTETDIGPADPLRPVCLDCKIASGGHVHVWREDGTEAVRYPFPHEWNASLRTALVAPAPEPTRLPEGVREAAEGDSPFAVADSIEEGRSLESVAPHDLPAATYLKGLVHRLVGAHDRVEMRRRALWNSHGKVLIEQKRAAIAAGAARAALEAATELIYCVRSAPKGSIGGIDTHYLPQIGREWLAPIEAKIEAGLASLSLSPAPAPEVKP